MTIPSDELVDMQRLVLPLHIDPADTLGKQQSFDAVDMCSPLMDQIVTLAVRAPQILFIDARNPHYRPDVAVAPEPRDQRAQQLADVDAIRLCPARSTIDLHAGGVDHQTFNAACLEKSRQPERVVTGFVAKYDRGCPPLNLAHRSRAAVSFAIRSSVFPPLIGYRLGCDRSGNWIPKSQVFLLSSSAQWRMLPAGAAVLVRSIRSSPSVIKDEGEFAKRLRRASVPLIASCG